jgi:hypothetical protein
MSFLAEGFDMLAEALDNFVADVVNGITELFNWFSARPADVEVVQQLQPVELTEHGGTEL